MPASVASGRLAQVEIVGAGALAALNMIAAARGPAQTRTAVYPQLGNAGSDIEADLTIVHAAQDAELLLGCFGRPPRADEQGRMVISKAMCVLLWTLWGLIQHANANPAADFGACANNRLRAQLATPGFARHVAAVAAGPSGETL